MCLQSCNLKVLLGQSDTVWPELLAPHMSLCHMALPQWGQASPLVSLHPEAQGEPLVIGMQPVRCSVSRFPKPSK